MSLMNRLRVAPALVAVSMLAAGPLLLSACSTGQSASQVTAQVLTDINLEASGLANALPMLAAQHSIPPATVGQAEALVAKVQAAAATMSATVTSAQAQATGTQIETDVNGLVSLLAGMPLPPAISGVLQAAVVLLPIIEAGVGMVVPVGASPSAMSAAQARMVLAAH